LVTSPERLAEFLARHRRIGIDTAPLIYHREWMPLTLSIADRAAQLRAEYRLRTPDAIQVATVIAGEATGLVTNDFGMRRVEGIEVLVLDAVVGGGPS